MYRQLSIMQDITNSFVHRIGPEQLLKDLPAKHEHVLLMCLDTAQQRMYQAYLDVSHSSSEYNASGLKPQCTQTK